MYIGVEHRKKCNILQVEFFKEIPLYQAQASINN